MKKILSITCYFFSITEILYLVTPLCSFENIPAALFFTYAYARAGYKLWTNNFTPDNLLIKTGIYFLEYLIALTAGVVVMCLANHSQFIASSTMCTIMMILIIFFKPTTVLRYIKEKV